MMFRSFWRGLLFALVFVLGCVLSLPAFSQAPVRSARHGGPMVSGVGPTRAVIWLRRSAAGLFRVEARDSAAGVVLGSAQMDVLAADSIVLLPLEKLRPNTRYTYEVWEPGQAKSIGSGQFRTPPADSLAATDFTFALGSCAFIHAPLRPEGYGIFQRIHEQKPDLMLWLGDNVYLWKDEWNDPAVATRRYAYTRRTAEMQPLLADAAQFAIWDDHDFGPNDADGTLPAKAAMLEVFRRFWPHTLYDAPPGSATGHFRWGDAEFFLLDDRSWRTPDKHTSRRARTQLGRGATGVAAGRIGEIDRYIQVRGGGRAVFKSESAGRNLRQRLQSGTKTHPANPRFSADSQRRVPLRRPSFRGA